MWNLLRVLQRLQTGLRDLCCSSCGCCCWSRCRLDLQTLFRFFLSRYNTTLFSSAAKYTRNYFLLVNIYVAVVCDTLHIFMFTYLYNLRRRDFVVIQSLNQYFRALWFVSRSFSRFAFFHIVSINEKSLLTPIGADLN